MAEDFCDFMDIDDEYVLQDITSQIVEFRKDKILEAHYESSLTLDTTEQYHEKLQYISVHKILIIIPWIVLQELDGLKSAWKNKPSSSQHEVGNLAQTAIKFLHSCFINKEEGLRGQKIDERIEMTENNDDKILDCCRYFQMVSQCPIVLLSNDKNLCVKAMIHDVITASYQKLKGLDSILEKILSKGESNSDEIIYLQNNEANPQKHFPNESNITAKPRDINGKLGHGQDVDAMMMDCDDVPLDFSSSTQNQVSTYDIQTQNSPVSSQMMIQPAFSTQTNYYNRDFSSIEDSIHAPKNKRRDLNAVPSNNSLVSQEIISQVLNDNNDHKRKESIGTSMIFERTSYVPECILSRKIELSQEHLVAKIISNLNNLLPPAISFHFQQCFDDHWTYVVKDPQPWSLSTMLKFMERYWFTVFSEVFQGINIEIIKNMISFISQWENYRINGKDNFIIGDIVQFVENSEIILMMVCADVKRNNITTIDLKQVTKNWWNEFESSLTMIL
ncbi:transcriptional protein SWT1-like [Rhizophagus clarus]|uniref:Transcriptional protein SWT1-like n=1 Tax=Rhizophagus clarus TaxID=94130 RepID=A0A8H3R3U7_9GLOM|nr:transcriptional protein SWT1-like [Rhizophagus clarus]